MLVEGNETKFIQRDSSNGAEIVKEEILTLFCVEDQSNETYFSPSLPLLRTLLTFQNEFLPTQPYSSLTQQQREREGKRREERFLVSKETSLICLNQTYNFVFALQLSASLFSLDSSTGEILFDKLYTAIHLILELILSPILPLHSVPSPPSFLPNIHLSLIAQAHSNPHSFNLLLHGLLLKSSLKHQIFQQIKQQLKNIENESANFYSQQ